MHAVAHKKAPPTGPIDCWTNESTKRLGTTDNTPFHLSKHVESRAAPFRWGRLAPQEKTGDFPILYTMKILYIRAKILISKIDQTLTIECTHFPIP